MLASIVTNAWPITSVASCVAFTLLTNTSVQSWILWGKFHSAQQVAEGFGRLQAEADVEGCGG